MLKSTYLFIITASMTIACTETKKEDLELTNKVILSSEIKWEKLNPARGERSPQAGTVWGDRKGKVPTGFLAKFVDGFSSPPHIHNVTYRALVIKGLIHNDDPKAKIMWMPAGSFWTQPAGEVHITSAKGNDNIAYVEIDKGPYLVKPVEEAFDNDERPVNVDRSNIIWLDSSEVKIIDKSKPDVETSFLWKSDNMTGNLIKLNTNFDGEIISDGDIFHAIVITGEAEYIMPKSGEIKSIDPGSYFTSRGKSKHHLRTNKGRETIIYIRTNDKFLVR